MSVGRWNARAISPLSEIDFIVPARKPAVQLGTTSRKA